MGTKHTPGPWAVERPYNEPGIYVTGANPRTSNPLICRLMDQAQAPEGEANARLIASAPAMLGVIRDLVEDFGAMTGGSESLDVARAILKHIDGGA